MIEVVNLTKVYGKNVALDGVSFTAKKGEVLGFLGSNGAGKSTTMNIMTGYISPNSGTAVVDGFDIIKQPLLAKAKIGYLPEQPPLYLNMMVIEYLSFVYELKKCRLDKEEHITSVMDKVMIKDVKNRLIKNLSKGYRQRVGLAQALIGNPEVLILDEPTVGLDVMQIIEIRNLIKELSKEHTIILSSHIMQEISAVCDRVVVINKGKVIAMDTPDRLMSMMDKSIRLIITADGDDESVLAVINGLEGVISVQKTNEGFSIEADRDIKRQLSLQLAKDGYPITSMKDENMSLEDVFINLTGEGK